MKRNKETAELSLLIYPYKKGMRVKASIAHDGMLQHSTVRDFKYLDYNVTLTCNLFIHGDNLGLSRLGNISLEEPYIPKEYWCKAIKIAAQHADVGMSELISFVPYKCTSGNISMRDKEYGGYIGIDGPYEGDPILKGRYNRVLQ